MIKIIYWTGTGNTGLMAKGISEGINQKGLKVESLEVDKATVEGALEADVLILGCPSMGCEELEDSEMEPFMEKLEEKLRGHKVALFGSYGWGDGQWMRDWAERITNCGAELVEEPLIINEFTNGEDEEKCIEYGKLIIA